MLIQRRVFNIGAVIVMLTAIPFDATARYVCNVLVKYPFPVFYQDTLVDSLARGVKLRIKIHSSTLRKVVSQEAITNNSGIAMAVFDYWNDRETQVNMRDINRMDVEFPDAERVVRIGKRILLEPVKFENMKFLEKTRRYYCYNPPTIHNHPSNSHNKGKLGPK